MVLAFGVQALLGTDGTVTFGCGQLPGRLQPGPVLPGQRLPLPGRVLAGLPDLIAAPASACRARASSASAA